MAIYLIIIIFLLVLVLFLLLRKKYEKLKEGFFEYNAQRKEIKEKNKEKIMNMFKEKGRIVNQEVQRALKISNATTIRYLDELEKESKITQKGKNIETYYVAN
jgi:Fic family protein